MVRGVFGGRKEERGRGVERKETAERLKSRDCRAERLQSELFAPGLSYLAALPFPENHDSWFWL